MSYLTYEADLKEFVRLCTDATEHLKDLETEARHIKMLAGMKGFDGRDLLGMAAQAKGQAVGYAKQLFIWERTLVSGMGFKMAIPDVRTKRTGTPEENTRIIRYLSTVDKAHKDAESQLKRTIAALDNALNLSNDKINDPLRNGYAMGAMADQAAQAAAVGIKVLKTTKTILTLCEWFEMAYHKLAHKKHH